MSRCFKIKINCIYTLSLIVYTYSTAVLYYSIVFYILYSTLSTLVSNRLNRTFFIEYFLELFSQTSKCKGKSSKSFLVLKPT